MSKPVIRKAQLLRGRTLTFTDAREDDASFILGLRTHSSKSRYLSKVSPALRDQVAWLRRYAARSDEAYFVIRSIDSDPIGTVRLYDARENSFCWGSWIIRDDAPSSCAIESALMVYRYALDVLDFECSHFQVSRANERVWAFHERFGAIRLGERADEYDYSISNDAIRGSLQKYARFCPGPLQVGGLT